jgi:hypothetical protein
MATSTATTTATSTSTDAPDDREDVEVGGPPSSIASDVPPRRQGRSNINEFLGKRSGDTASAMAPSSAVPPDPPGRRDWQSSRDEYNRKVPPEDAPTRTRGFGLAEFQGELSSSATDEKEEERPCSEGVGGVVNPVYQAMGQSSLGLLTKLGLMQALSMACRRVNRTRLRRLLD